MVDYGKKLYEDWQARLEMVRMRKPRLAQAGSALSHLGSQGIAQNAIPNSYRSPGPAQAAPGSALSTWKPRNGMMPTPMSGKGGKLYKPRQKPSIKTKAGSVLRGLSNA